MRPLPIHNFFRWNIFSWIKYLTELSIELEMGPLPIKYLFELKIELNIYLELRPLPVKYLIQVGQILGTK